MDDTTTIDDPAAEPTAATSPDAGFYPLRILVTVAVLATLGVTWPAALVFLALILVLIVTHEAGHFVVARRCGMRPTEFFAGFGPELWATTSSTGVRWGVKAVPLGGYVKIPGMTQGEEIAEDLEPFTYRAATRPRRLATVLAGVVVNLLSAVGFFTAYAVLNPDANAPLWPAFRYGITTTVEIARLTVVGVGQFFSSIVGYFSTVLTGGVPEDRFVSLVGGAQLTEQYAANHPTMVFLLAGAFATSLAVLNLLPLLPFDGGHAAVVIVEGALAKLRRRPNLTIDAAKLTAVAVVVLAVFIAISATAVWLDITNPIELPAS